MMIFSKKNLVLSLLLVEDLLQEKCLSKSDRKSRSYNHLIENKKKIKFLPIFKLINLNSTILLCQGLTLKFGSNILSK